MVKTLELTDEQSKIIARLLLKHAGDIRKTIDSFTVPGAYAEALTETATELEALAKKLE